MHKGGPEERPDVDQVYMEAVNDYSEGGWPLNVFCLPDGRPFLRYLFPARRRGNGLVRGRSF